MKVKWYLEIWLVKFLVSGWSISDVKFVNLVIVLVSILLVLILCVNFVIMGLINIGFIKKKKLVININFIFGVYKCVFINFYYFLNFD